MMCGRDSSVRLVRDYFFLFELKHSLDTWTKTDAQVEYLLETWKIQSGERNHNIIVLIRVPLCTVSQFLVCSSAFIIRKVEKMGCTFLSRVADPDLDSIGSVNPDPDSESRSGSRRAKMTHKSKKKKNFSSCFEVLDGLFWEPKASSVTWTFFMEA